MAEAAPCHVLIIGAGITGLVIAHGLHRAGIPYDIFETEEQGRWRSKEWTMGIHWGLELLENLLPPNLAARIPTDGSVDASLDYEVPPNNGAHIYDGVSGKMVKDLTQPGQRIVRVSRRRLRMLCQVGIEVKWGHALDNVTRNSDTTVTASFTNGKKYTGTILVGADGPKSLVRNFLFDGRRDGQEKAMENVVGMSMAVSYSAEEAKLVRSAHSVWCIGLSPKLFVFQSTQDVPDPQRPETWKFFLFPSWIGERDESLDNAGRMRELKERGAAMAEPFRTCITSIPDDTQIPYIDVNYWIAKPWDTREGTVTLAGDAAHPMPPFRGQGGNHAIQDAHNFVEAVKKIAAAGKEDAPALQAELIQEYSDEVAKRGAEETELSIRNGIMCMKYDAFFESPYYLQGLKKG